MVAVLMVSTSSLAGEARTHDGFLLRLSAGGGYAETAIDLLPFELDTLQTETVNFELSGASGDINFAIGGMVTPNLAVHGTLWGWLVSSPDVKVDGTDAGTLDDYTVNMSAYGAGITYYFMPINIYVSPSIGLAILSVEEGGTSASTDTGFAFDATVGKEWWVGDGWGIGVAGAFGWYSVPDGDIDEKWSGPGFAVRFTATMN
jgi:hypothetical protein